LIDKSVGFMGTSAIVGNSIPLGVGLGLSAQLRKTDQISIVFLGDGAIEEGVFYESVNFAVLRNLPVLFICENNLYSVYSPLSVRQPKNRKISEMVSAIGANTAEGNGNDVDEAYNLIKGTINKIRLGEGPFFLEFETYRYREHCGHNFDNELGYRTIEEFEFWKERDSIKNCKDSMLKLGQINEKEINELYEKIQLEVDQAFLYAEEAPFPSPDTAFQDVYSDLKE
ncbi:MAG: thiamine pyrophosphate-dependent dehydrogenase E1 component subunit alpha, partial [Pseudomonadota bacterium]|nr:thiamine pyrophosphate-dependent dehydrogenase E1 component subunit alpha [Pseudomonadota bacterium]